MTNGKVQDLSGRTVYVSMSETAAPVPAVMEELVGEGRLISYPNDVVAGSGSVWTHEGVVRNKFSMFGCTVTDQRLGHRRSAKCVLELAVDWAWENRDPLSDCDYAEIGYKIEHRGEIVAVYAGKFMFTKKTHPLSVL